MESITDEEIKMIKNRLNNLPRELLGYRTPAEVFYNRLAVLHFVLEAAL
jgi:IS30 family transposase